MRIVCLGVVAILGALATWNPPCRGSELRQSPIVKAVQQVRPAIVNIRGEKFVAPSAAQAAPAEGNRRVNGMGTGVILDPRGYIVTNFHVVDGVREIQVTLATKEQFTARLVARDVETDLAVIKIESPQKLQVITIGTSSDLMPGETVIAVGNAYGYENTVTRGIISALHRAVQVSDAQYYDDLIQTDASINPGNSGGPLLNIDGELIGINVAVRAGAQGIGFAIPVDKVLAVAAELIATSNAKAVHLGATVNCKTRPGESGVPVVGVDPNSPAAAAGLEPGDVIHSAGGNDIARALDFQRALVDLKAGETLDLVVARNVKEKDKVKSQEVTLHVALAEPAKEGRPALQPAWEMLGLELRVIPGDEFRQSHQGRYRGGLKVVAVKPESPAAAQGIRVGDVLVGLHIWETISLENVTYILNRPDFESFTPLKFLIVRDNEPLYGYIPLAAKETPRTE